MFRATMCPSSGADDCVMLSSRVGMYRGCRKAVKTVVWYAGAYAPAYHTTLCYELIHGRTTCQPDLTTLPQPRHIPTRGYNITQSSAPDDGYMVVRNILSNY
jgi:hypothetical protein